MNELLLYFTIKFNGDWEKIFNALKNKEDFNEHEFIQMKQHQKEKYITILDENYPQVLREISKPPFVIFYEGNFSLLKKMNKSRRVFVFGSYQDENIKSISEELEKINQVLVLSSSSIIEREIICNYHSKIILVSHNGISNDLLYAQKVLSQNGLIISEYPFWDQEKENDLSKYKYSKIIIALSYGILLINSLKEKKLFKLISYFLEEKKEIFCLSNKKNAINYIDNNHNAILIEKGATKITNINQLKVWEKIW